MKQIEWSPKALKEYLDLTQYLIDKWGAKTATKFLNRVGFILSNIAKRPEMFPATDHRKNVRRCVLSKQTSLYYRIQDKKIEIITLFDTRQNPLKRKL